jgi:predicted ArsR family transcriptional regulator
LDGVLQYLRSHGQGFDTEIAAAIGMPIEKVRRQLADLSADGDVLVCRSIQFKEGQPVEAMLCRVSGYIPPASPGRKPKR